MDLFYVFIAAIAIAGYFWLVRPRLEKAAGRKFRGWDALDEELPYTTVVVVACAGLTALATAACYYFDSGIDVSAEEARRSTYSGMILFYFFILTVALGGYFWLVRPRLEKAAGRKFRGWDALDEGLRYTTVVVVACAGLTALATAACYYFDSGIDVSAEEVRHSIYAFFSFGLGISFFGLFLPRMLHFRYNDFTFSKPLSGWGALLLIVATFVALWPLIKYVAELITKGLEMVWGFVV